MLRQELEAAWSHHIHRHYQYQKCKGGAHTPSTPTFVINSPGNPPAKCPVRSLEALEFTALGLSRWDESGLLKVLLALSLVREASEHHLTSVLTLRDPGSHHDYTQEQLIWVDGEKTACFLFFASLSVQGSPGRQLPLCL